jgi:phage major head subunit gpT-like protein/phage head maturation protease
MNTIKLETTVDFLQAAEGDATGSPKKFRIVAYTGSPIRQSWSREPVVIDVAGMKLPKSVPIVIGHDYALGSILGKGTPTVEGGQLVVEGEILADSEAARQITALAERGYEWQASVGADVRRHQKVDADAATTVNGQTHVGPVRIVKASALREVSFVTLGADAATSVSIAAEEAVEEAPMAANANQTPDKVKAESEAPAIVAGGPHINESLPVKAVGGDGASLGDSQPAIEALRKQIVEDVKATFLAHIREERPAAPAVHVAKTPARTPEVIEAAFALQGGLPNVEKRYSAETLEAASKIQRHTSLGEVVLQAANENGYDGPQRVSASTLRPIMQAAWATHSIADILSSTVNKFLLAGFDSVESAWRSISTVRSVNDFKTVTSYRLNGGFKFEAVANGGELKNAKATDEKRSISAETYGIMTSVTRTDLINDDLGALTAVPQRIGRGGALKLNDVFWAEFVDDSAFFTSGRANLRSGSHALSVANLKALATLYRKLKDPDGNPVAIEPRILLVPPDLEITAAEIMGSSILHSATAVAGGVPERNVLAGRYQVVQSVYLTNTTDYYLLASPADLPVMEVAFLNGVQSPIVETAEADFNTLGVQMRGYFDFGCAKAEYLAGVKCDTSA